MLENVTFPREAKTVGSVCTQMRSRGVQFGRSKHSLGIWPCQKNKHSQLCTIKLDPNASANLTVLACIPFSSRRYKSYMCGSSLQ